MPIQKMFAVLALIATPALAEEQSDARAARVMWSAFECFQFAQMSADRGNAKRLFELGYGAGQRFLTALEAGEISEEEARATVPIGVTFLLGGPTHDFIIGRVFEAATGKAYDSIVKESELGLTLPVDEWIQDDELRRSRAQLHYLRGNCDAL